MGIIDKIGAKASPKEKPLIDELKSELTKYKAVMKKVKSELQQLAKELRADTLKREFAAVKEAADDYLHPRYASPPDAATAQVVNDWVAKQRAFIAMIEAFEKAKFKAFFKTCVDNEKA
jgi:hypothetical protein